MRTQNIGERTDTNLLLLRGVDSVARVSNNVILIKTTGEERLTCVDDQGKQTQITVANETEVAIGQSSKAAAASIGLDSKQERKVKGPAGKREIKQKAARDSTPDRPDSPKLSLPPEVELLPQASAKHAESNVEIQKLTDALTTLSTGEDISSLSANLKDFLPKILRVDIENKRLKETVAHLEEELAKYKNVKQRLSEPRRKAETDSSQSKKDHELPDGDSSRRQQEELLKMRKQLKKAIDANQAWSNYSNDQLKIHLRQLHANDETVRKLQEKLNSVKAEASSHEQQYKTRIAQLDSDIKEHKDKLEEIQSENNNIMDRNQQLEAEQRKVRKLAKGLIKEKEDLKKETERMKLEIDELTLAEDKISRHGEAKSNGTTSSTSTNLSHPLRNVESAMDKEDLTEAEKEEFTKSKPDNPDSGVSTGTCSPTDSNEGATRTTDNTTDAIFILQEQVNQFKEDFNRERQDRERAFGEIDKLKKELENTKLLLHQQSEPATKKKSKNVAALFSSKQKKKKEQQGAAFEYMSPDEVAALQRQRATRDQRRTNTYEEEREEGNHVYHEIED